MSQESYLALSIIASIHPGDREAIEETITAILCPFGHFPEDGDQPEVHECRMVAQMSTVVDDVETALRWISSDVPDTPAFLDETP
jgi:hypothetical protein